MWCSTLDCQLQKYQQRTLSIAQIHLHKYVHINTSAHIHTQFLPRSFVTCIHIHSQKLANEPISTRFTLKIQTDGLLLILNQICSHFIILSLKLIFNFCFCFNLRMKLNRFYMTLILMCGEHNLFTHSNKYLLEILIFDYKKLYR